MRVMNDEQVVGRQRFARDLYGAQETYPEAAKAQHCHFDPSAWRSDGDLTCIRVFIAEA